MKTAEQLIESYLSRDYDEWWGISVMQGERDRYRKALKKLRMEPDAQGYSDGSTTWTFLFSVLNKKGAYKLRAKLFSMGFDEIEVVSEVVEL